MIAIRKNKSKIISFSVASIFTLLYLTIFYAFGFEDSAKGFPLVSIVRMLFVFVFSLVLIINKSIFRLAYRYENIFLKLVILFFLYQLFQVFYNGSPYSGLAKYLYFFCIIFIVVFNNFNNSHFKINKINNFTMALFIIILAFYIFYMLQHPFSTSFRETRIDLLNWNNNENAGFFATALPFAIFILRKRKILLYCFLTFFLYVFIFYNGSIAAIVSSIIILIIYFYLNSRDKKLFGIFYFFLFIIIIYVFIIQLTKFDVVFSGGIGDVLSGKTQEGNLAGRIGGIWIPVINYVTDHNFLFGYGSNSWADVSRKAGTYWLQSTGSKDVYVFRDAHNFFLVTFVEGGIVNLFFILAFFILGIRSCLFAIRKSVYKYDKNYAVTVLSSWFGLITWCMMYNAWYSGGWYFFTILLSLSLIMKNRAKRTLNLIISENRTDKPQ